MLGKKKASNLQTLNMHNKIVYASIQINYFSFGWILYLQLSNYW